MTMLFCLFFSFLFSAAAVLYQGTAIVRKVAAIAADVLRPLARGNLYPFEIDFIRSSRPPLAPSPVIRAFL